MSYVRGDKQIQRNYPHVRGAAIQVSRVRIPRRCQEKSEFQKCSLHVDESSGSEECIRDPLQARAKLVDEPVDEPSRGADALNVLSGAKVILSSHQGTRHALEAPDPFFCGQIVPQ